MGSTGVLLRRRDSFKPFLEGEWNQPNILTVMHWGPSILIAFLCQLQLIARCGVGLRCPLWGQGHLLSLDLHLSCFFSCVGKGCLQEIGHSR